MLSVFYSKIKSTDMSVLYSILFHFFYGFIRPILYSLGLISRRYLTLLLLIFSSSFFPATHWREEADGEGNGGC